MTHNQGQSSSALGIDEEQSGNGRHDLNSTIAERCIQRLGSRVAHILKDGGTVEGDN